MRKGGSIIALIAGVFSVIAAIAVIALAQMALMTTGATTSMERDQGITCLLFSFGVLIASALAIDIKNAACGYLCLIISVIGTILAPVIAMPFLGLAAIGSIFIIIGGHIDHHRARQEKLKA